MEAHIKDPSLATQGARLIEWAGARMPVLALLRQRFSKSRSLKGVRIGACLHVTAETANLLLTLRAGGAQVALCASNPLSTQDAVAAALARKYKLPVFAIRGEAKSYYQHVERVLSTRPHITLDDGGDLVAALHKRLAKQTDRLALQGKKLLIEPGWEFYGSAEETTTGVIRLKAMEQAGELKIPVVAVNDSYTKYLFDNRYGTGQSTIDGILRATNVLLAGKKFVVCGYGWCGRGLAARARGMGAQVIVTEVDPIRALEAVMDGFAVLPMRKAAKIGDIFVTVTGDKSVITLDHLLTMPDGAIVANSGHFDVEVEVAKLAQVAVRQRKLRPNVVEYELSKDGTRGATKRIYVLGEGRLVNLVAAEGHPAEVMDMSFANQALAVEWLIQQRGQLTPRVYRLPEKLDRRVARLKLQALNVKIDRLTPEQKQYLANWQEGT